MDIFVLDGMNGNIFGVLMAIVSLMPFYSGRTDDEIIKTEIILIGVR